MCSHKNPEHCSLVRRSKSPDAGFCSTYIGLYGRCRLSFKGVGECICFIAFGPLATSAFYLAHVSTCDPEFAAFHLYMVSKQL